MTQPSAGPLSGITVIDFTRLIAGPAASDLLASLGATVVKVESLDGDPMRNTVSKGVGPQPTSPTFAAYNVLKTTVTLDLKDPEDRAHAVHLCAGADVVMQAFRPGVMERLGLGPDILRARNPQLIIAGLSAFGTTGPDRDRGGVDIVLQAESGLMSVTGEPDGQPLKVGVPIIDAASGYVLALGIVTALVGRLRGRRGSEDVEVSMIDVGVHLQAQAFAEYLAAGAAPERVGNQAPYAAPAELYQAADGEFVLSAHLPAHWAQMCALIGRPDLVDDPRFATVGDRVHNRDALNAILQVVFADETAAHWIDTFTAHGLTAGRVRSYPEVEAALAESRDPAIVDAHNVDGSPLRVVRPPLRFGGWSDTALTRQVPQLMPRLRAGAAEGQQL